MPLGQPDSQYRILYLRITLSGCITYLYSAMYIKQRVSTLDYPEGGCSLANDRCQDRPKRWTLLAGKC